MIDNPKEVIGPFGSRGQSGIGTNERVVPKGGSVYVVEGSNSLIGRVLPKDSGKDIIKRLTSQCKSCITGLNGEVISHDY